MASIALDIFIDAYVWEFVDAYMSYVEHETTKQATAFKHERAREWKRRTEYRKGGEFTFYHALKVNHRAELHKIKGRKRYIPIW